MQTQHLRVSFITLVAGAVLALGGCTKKSDTATADSTSVTRTDTVQNGTAATADTTRAATPQLSDANILAMLSESDSAEIVEAKAVLAKTKNADVKGFANMMVTDHTKLKKEGEDLAKKINVVPQPPANDPNPGELTSTMSMINGATDPHALDSEYINHAVDDHTKDLSSLQDWSAKAQNADLKAAIQKAMPVVQKHLDKAKAIQDKLSKMPASAKKK